MYIRTEGTLGSLPNEKLALVGLKKLRAARNHDRALPYFEPSTIE